LSDFPNTSYFKGGSHYVISQLTRRPWAPSFQIGLIVMPADR